MTETTLKALRPYGEAVGATFNLAQAPTGAVRRVVQQYLDDNGWSDPLAVDELRGVFIHAARAEILDSEAQILTGRRPLAADIDHG